MENLELVRVHETGRELVVRDASGTDYLLPMDEELRTAVLQARPATAPQALTLAPREIQARIRAGASAAQIAEESGASLEHILKYEGPVLAERDHIARLARAVEVSGPLGNEGYRAVFGDEPASLGDMVATRLRTFGVDPDTLVWDAWKVDAGTWRIAAAFRAPQGPSTIGEEPPAEWAFHPARRHLENANRWSQVLSEWEPWDSSTAPRRLTPVTDRPFDVEQGGGGFASEPESPEPSHGGDEHLLDVLTRRRGTRVGEDVESDDELAHLIAQRHIEREREQHDDDRREGRGRRSKRRRHEPEQQVAQPERTDGRQEPEAPERLWPPLRRVPDPAPQPAPETQQPRAEEPSAAAEDDASQQKKRRSHVPSWDEIVFGRSAKGDDDA